MTVSAAMKIKKTKIKTKERKEKMKKNFKSNDDNCDKYIDDMATIKTRLT